MIRLRDIVRLGSWSGSLEGKSSKGKKSRGNR